MIEAFGVNQYLLMAFNDRPAGLWWLIYIITQLGSSLALALLASATFLLGKNKVKIFAMVLLVGVFFSVVVLDDIKDLVKRPRPEGASQTQFLFINDYSFPSGHALVIFLAASVLGAYYGWKFYLAGYMMALVVSLSRLYLGVHYPSDALAGAILGIVMGEMLVYAAYRLRLCDNVGLLSLIFKNAKAVSVKYDTGAFNGNWPLSIICFIAVPSSLVLHYMGNATLAIFIIVIAIMLVILYVAFTKIPVNSNLLIIFIFISLGFVTALSTFYLGAYVVSLSIIILTYVTVVLLAHIKIKTINGHKG
jgi:undecaprenyl-diphosphatase